MDRKLKSYTLLATAQLAIASNVIIGKQLAGSIPTCSYMFVRFSVAALILFLLRRFVSPLTRLRSKPRGYRLTSRDYLNLFGQALTAGFLFNMLFFLGLRSSPATVVGIISSMFPVVLALLSYFLLKEHFGRNKILATAFSMLGILVLSVKSPGDPSLGGLDWVGALLVFLALIPEAMQSIFLKWLSPKVDPAEAANWVTLFAALLSLPLCLWDVSSSQGPASWSARDGVLLLGSGVCSSVFFLCWSKGVRGVEASVAALFGGVLPVGVALLAAVFLGEELGICELGGLLCVLTSLVMGRAEENQPLDGNPWYWLRNRLKLSWRKTPREMV